MGEIRKHSSSRNIDGEGENGFESFSAKRSSKLLARSVRLTTTCFSKFLPSQILNFTTVNCLRRPLEKEKGISS